MSDATLTERITAYLSGGGLFNPELAIHDAVRDLLIDARSELAAARAEVERLKGELATSKIVAAIHQQDVWNLTEKVIPNIREKAEADLAALKREQLAGVPRSLLMRWRLAMPVLETMLSKIGAFDASKVAATMHAEMTEFLRDDEPDVLGAACYEQPAESASQQDGEGK